MDLVSACLLGFACRYDGTSRPDGALLAEARGGALLPVCPEQMGGLATPREPSVLVGGDGRDVLAGRARVESEGGRDVTGAFLRGAREALRLAELSGATRARLKSKSPSCALASCPVRGRAAPGMGVTAALLAEHGLEIVEVDG